MGAPRGRDRTYNRFGSASVCAFPCSWHAMDKRVAPIFHFGGYAAGYRGSLVGDVLGGFKPRPKKFVSTRNSGSQFLGPKLMFSIFMFRNVRPEF